MMMNSGLQQGVAKPNPSANKAIVKKLTNPADITSALPFRTAQSSANVQGKDTNVLTQHFVDRILVVVTQLGKIGDLTQITTHKRPTLPNIFDDDLLNDDFDAGRVVNDRRRQQERSEDEEDNERRGEDEHAIALDSTTTTSSLALFGTVPAGQETLYDFYRQQISALIQKEMGGATHSEDGLGSKPIIVGLSLSLPQSRAAGAAADDDDQAEQEDDFSSLAETERIRYQAILRLVKEARTW